MEELVRKEIASYVAGNPGTPIAGHHSPYLDEALIGFSSASDPIFADYKEPTAPSLPLLPGELLPEANASAISWVLPMSSGSAESTAGRLILPPALTRTHGDAVNSWFAQVSGGLAGREGHRPTAAAQRSLWQALDIFCRYRLQLVGTPCPPMRRFGHFQSEPRFHNSAWDCSQAVGLPPPSNWLLPVELPLAMAKKPCRNGSCGA